MKIFNFKSHGFTLIEMAVVIGISTTLLGFITINLVRSQQTVSLTSAEEILLTDLRAQQLKSMIGDTEGGSTSDSYGIHFDSNRYVLFHGGTYSQLETSNSIINLDSNMQFNNPGFNIIFSKIGGEITTPVIVELQNNTNSKFQRVHLNIYGVITQAESL